MNQTANHSAWDVKYKPKRLEEMILTETVSDKVIRLRDKQSTGIILFHGLPGTGKTTAGRLIGVPNATIYINCMADSSKSQLQQLDRDCCSATMFDDRRVVLLDEVNKLTPKALENLQTIIDRHKKKTLIILMVNETKKLSDTFLSRLGICEFPLGKGNPQLIDEMVKRGQDILEQEGKTLDEDVIRTIARRCDPDIRQYLIRLQDEAQRARAT